MNMFRSLSLPSATPGEAATSLVVRREALFLAAVLLVTAAVHATSADFSYVNYDDPIYMTYVNSHAADGIGLDDVRGLFIDVVNSNWHPVTLVSYYLDYYLHSLDPGLMHLHNALIHLINVVLLFLLARKLFPQSAIVRTFVVLAFALHPVNVGTIGWLAERKGLLSALFAFASMLAYCRFRDMGGRTNYAVSVVLFALSIMSKATSVVLPLVLILIDWHRYGRPLVPHTVRHAAGMFWAKGPYFLLALGAGLLTIRAHTIGGALAAMDIIPFPVRLANFVTSLPAYLRMLVIPAEFAFYYPYDSNIDALKTAAATAVLIGITLAAYFLRKRIPIITFSIIWFLLWLLPLSGLIKSGPHFIADRYMYIAGIGIFTLMGTALQALFARGRRRLVTGTLAGLAALYTGSTYVHLQFWHSPITLYTHALDITQKNLHAEANLVRYYASFGDRDRAMKHYRRLLTYAPYSFSTHKGLAEHLLAWKYYDEAREVIGKALTLYEGNPQLLALKSELLRGTGRVGEAIALCEDALDRFPEIEIFALQLGRIHADAGRYDKAVEYFNKALAINPDNPVARQRLEEIRKKQAPAQTAERHLDTP